MGEPRKALEDALGPFLYMPENEHGDRICRHCGNLECHGHRLSCKAWPLAQRIRQAFAQLEAKLEQTLTNLSHLGATDKELLREVIAERDARPTWDDAKELISKLFPKHAQHFEFWDRVERVIAEMQEGRE